MKTFGSTRVARGTQSSIRPLAILHLITELGRGGAERMLVDLVGALDARRFRSIVVTVRAEPDDLAADLIKLGVPVSSLSARRGVDIAAVARLQRILTDERIQILHTHLPAAGLIARAAAELPPRPKTVYTAHNVPSGFGRPARSLDCASLRLVDHVVWVSNSVREAWLGCRGRRPSSVIYGGIALPPPQTPSARERIRREFGIASDAVVIGTVGNLFPRKGHKYLLRACKNLLAPGRRILVIVGDGPLKAPLESLARDLDATEVVRITGKRDDVPDVLQAFDIFALPSVAEGLPIALLEAMAASLPAIVTDAGGNAEAVVHGLTGFVVPPRDVGQLEQRVGELVKDAALRRQFGEAARARVESKFAVLSMAREHERLYLRLLDSAG